MEVKAKECTKHHHVLEKIGAYPIACLCFLDRLEEAEALASQRIFRRLEKLLNETGTEDVPWRHMILGIASGYPDCCIQFFCRDWYKIEANDKAWREYMKPLRSLPLERVPCRKCRAKLLRALKREKK